MQMPFGKYRGRRIQDLPSSYLVWLLEGCDDLRGYLEDHVRAELTARFGAGHRAAATCRRCDQVRQLLDGWYRRWSLRLHPDRGGDTAAMAALNGLREELEKVLR